MRIEEIEKLILEGKLDIALVELEKFHSKIQNQKDQVSYGKACYYLGNIYENFSFVLNKEQYADHKDKAYKYYEEAAKYKNNDAILAITKKKEKSCRESKGNYQEAIKDYETLLKQDINDNMKAYINYRLAKIYSYSDPEKSMSYLNNSLELLKDQKGDNSILSDKVYYLKIDELLKDNKLEEAKKCIDSISKDSKYQAKSEALIKKYEIIKNPQESLNNSVTNNAYRASLDQILEVFPDDPDILFQKVRTLHESSPDQCKEILLDLLSKQNDEVLQKKYSNYLNTTNSSIARKFQKEVLDLTNQMKEQEAKNISSFSLSSWFGNQNENEKISEIKIARINQISQIIFRKLNHNLTQNDYFKKNILLSDVENFCNIIKPGLEKIIQQPIELKTEDSLEEEIDSLINSTITELEKIKNTKDEKVKKVFSKFEESFEFHFIKELGAQAAVSSGENAKPHDGPSLAVNAGLIAGTAAGGAMSTKLAIVGSVVMFFKNLGENISGKAINKLDQKAAQNIISLVGQNKDSQTQLETEKVKRISGKIAQRILKEYAMQFAHLDLANEEQQKIIEGLAEQACKNIFHHLESSKLQTTGNIVKSRFFKLLGIDAHQKSDDEIVQKCMEALYKENESSQNPTIFKIQFTNSGKEYNFSYQVGKFFSQAVAHNKGQVDGNKTKEIEDFGLRSSSANKAFTPVDLNANRNLVSEFERCQLLYNKYKNSDKIVDKKEVSKNQTGLFQEYKENYNQIKKEFIEQNRKSKIYIAAGLLICAAAIAVASGGLALPAIAVGLSTAAMLATGIAMLLKNGFQIKENNQYLKAQSAEYKEQSLEIEAHNKSLLQKKSRLVTQSLNNPEKNKTDGEKSFVESLNKSKNTNHSKPVSNNGDKKKFTDRIKNIFGVSRSIKH